MSTMLPSSNKHIYLRHLSSVLLIFIKYVLQESLLQYRLRSSVSSLLINTAL